MTSRPQMIINVLQANPGQQFTARQLAQKIIDHYSAELAEKRKNPRFTSDEDFLSQITAEVGGSRTVKAKAMCPQVMTRDKPRPRLFYWGETVVEKTDSNVAPEPTIETVSLTEHSLYPILIDYLSQEEGLLCRRIDEKRSSNNKGLGGNHWLYPDIVALEPLDKEWDDVVQNCVRHSEGRLTRLWSFEVKKQLNRSNVRECFFQAVSNSSWAHFGYLVATEINEDKQRSVERELQMLCALHGIGVILLDPHDFSNSQTLIPARERTSVDWQSVNRLVEENRDFKDFIELVGEYHQTGKIHKTLWNK
ncbi:HrgA protein [Enterobacter hormaechei]|uniref:COG2958 family protein n=1 Tax=Enterobacter hormaechei TaxID=158836 RepID=UPI000F9134C7|nr:HrgA protein [Enterobacter hormaechei]EBY2574059.1 HrgA protein [Salmonella enterica subsp. enterica serovar Newport]ECE7415198.1 HrgA protein [Salmonella enterica subsp. enterica serovar Newport]EKD5910685.1 HrgA protein [Salmonella enterica subsp. enterica serovar Newport]EKD5922253.1 HrgA protein [Salmonella enterica subsp. enterica serovar Newport]MDY3571464.1 HrgA protein [Enterobacter hormaechei]